MKEFRAAIKDGCALGSYIPVKFDVEQEFGKKRIKVKGTIDGIDFQGVIAPVIPFGNILVLKHELMEKIGKEIGVQVTIRLTPR